MLCSTWWQISLYTRDWKLRRWPSNYLISFFGPLPSHAQFQVANVTQKYKKISKAVGDLVKLIKCYIAWSLSGENVPPVEKLSLHFTSAFVTLVLVVHLKMRQIRKSWIPHLICTKKDMYLFRCRAFRNSLVLEDLMHELTRAY